MDMCPKGYKARPTESQCPQHQTPAWLPSPPPQNFNPAVTQEPQIRTQYGGLSSLPMTQGWEAEPI